VYALNLTISFWWITAVAKLSTILLLDSVIYSMTFYLYKNELKTAPDVDYVIPLYFTLWRSDVTKIVSLVIFSNYWALLAEVIEHNPNHVNGL
jgi:hypothetical protein